MRTSQKALLAPISLLLAGLLLLAGCGDDAEPEAGADATPTASDTPSATDSPSKSPKSSKPSKEATPEGQSIDITITHDSVSPNGDRVEVELGEPITLNIDAADAGELHVHSTPEQVLAYPAGKSSQELTIDRPGVVEVEDHHLEMIVVQLQVS